MPDFLTRRNGTWHFVRRVPAEYAHYDKRGVVRHSTKVRVASDRTGRRAVRVADKLNTALEAYWAQCAGAPNPAVSSYELSRQRARSLSGDEERFYAQRMWRGAKDRENYPLTELARAA